MAPTHGGCDSSGDRRLPPERLASPRRGKSGRDRHLFDGDTAQRGCPELYHRTRPGHRPELARQMDERSRYLDPNGATDLFTFQLKSDSLVTLVDLGSEGNRIEATLGTLGDGTQPMERLFKDLLDGVSASSVTLPAGIYQVRISASGEDPSISGRYSFSVKLN